MGVYKHVCAVAVASVLLLGLTTAQAADKEPAAYQKDFEGWSSTVAQLQKADTGGVTGTEIEMIRTLVSQGQAFLAGDKLDAIDPLLMRAEAIAWFVRSKHRRLKLEAQANAMEAQAAKTQGEAVAIKTAADTVEARFEKLEAQGL